ncbi:hypothetical protein C2845_PM15G00530 [Panicum miliaceum]|uniref:Uncharacterized protein n=1 Tax=Panicum miliaceum TaxID=4540 RepID=A0A3L6QAT3_PANMI|nr:hypothetical protein C2845_PM15G00530 [Panicum miliaceum]
MGQLRSLPSPIRFRPNPGLSAEGHSPEFPSPNFGKGSSQEPLSAMARSSGSFCTKLPVAASGGRACTLRACRGAAPPRLLAAAARAHAGPAGAPRLRGGRGQLSPHLRGGHACTRRACRGPRLRGGRRQPSAPPRGRAGPAGAPRPHGGQRQPSDKRTSVCRRMTIGPSATTGASASGLLFLLFSCIWTNQACRFILGML